MSVTFHIEGQRPDYEDESTFVNLANGNAFDLLAWLALPVEPWGAVSARELAARCRRRLWDVERNQDPERPSFQEGNFILCGRRPGYLRERTGELLRLADSAGDARIQWS
jgi:hypothetical protein